MYILALLAVSLFISGIGIGYIIGLRIGSYHIQRIYDENSEDSGWNDEALWWRKNSVQILDASDRNHDMG